MNDTERDQRARMLIRQAKTISSNQGSTPQAFLAGWHEDFERRAQATADELAVSTRASELYEADPEVEYPLEDEDFEGSPS